MFSKSAAWNQAFIGGLSDEMRKLAANRLSAGLKIPGLANAGKPAGLANPTRAGGQNLAKFQLAGPGKTPMTGKSQSVVASQSLANSGQTGSLSLPAPMTPRGPQ